MEKIRSKDGKIKSYREKVYVNGKAISKTFKRKSDALKWKSSFACEQRKREALGIAHIQSVDFKSFIQEWIEMKDGQGVSRRTVETYQAAIKNYLLPVVGKTKLENIHLGLAQKVIQRSRKRGLKASRTNMNLRVLGQILNDAVRLNYLVRNPLAGMKKVKEPPRSLTYWIPEQIKQFLDANRDNPFYPIYALALNTGMRRGELLGLCWDRVNFNERRIEISRIRDRYELKNTTKTGFIRHLPLNDAAFRVLSKLAQNKHHETLVFADKTGKLPNIRHFSDRHFRRAIEKAKVPRIRFHDLRTTYASNFVMAGGDIFALSKLLGHTSVEMTAKKYAALHPSFMRQIVQTVQFEAEEPLEKSKRVALQIVS